MVNLDLNHSNLGQFGPEFPSDSFFMDPNRPLVNGPNRPDYHKVAEYRFVLLEVTCSPHVDWWSKCKVWNLSVFNIVE